MNDQELWPYLLSIEHGDLEPLWEEMERLWQEIACLTNLRRKMNPRCADLIIADDLISVLQLEKLING